MKKFLVIVLGMLFVFGLSTMSWAGAELKISDKTKATLGIFGWIWAQSLEDAITTDKGTDNKTDFSLRLLRLYTSGQIGSPLVKFGASVDWNAGAWDGRAATVTTVQVTDANMTLAFAPEVNVLAGLHRTPFSRAALTDALTGVAFLHFPGIAAGSYMGAIGNFRNAGITLWGDALGGKIKYGAGIFDGDLVPSAAGSQPTDDSPFYSVRLAVSPLVPQKGYTYGGQYLGKAKKPVLTVGAGYLASKYRTATPTSATTAYTTTETATGVHTTTATTTAAGSTTTAEPTYSAYTVDLYTEIPLGGGALSVEGAYFNYDRDITNGVTKGYDAKIAFFIPGVNILPAFRYEVSDRDGTVTGGEDFKAWAAALNYYLVGSDAKITLEYLSKDYENEGTTARTNKDYADLTLQLQFVF